MLPFSNAPLGPREISTVCSWEAATGAPLAWETWTIRKYISGSTHPGRDRVLANMGIFSRFDLTY